MPRDPDMKRIPFTILLLLTVLAPLWGPAAESPAVSVEVIHSRDQYPAGDVHPLLLRLRIPQGLFIHGPAGLEHGSGLIPTEVSFEGAPGVSVRDVRFPEPQLLPMPFQPEPVPLFEGTVLVRVRLSVERAAAPGLRSMVGALSYQACSDASCLPPETTRVEIRLRVAPPGTGVSLRNQELFQAPLPDGGRRASPSGFPQDAGTLITLVGLFLGGLALNLTPCINPLIPITDSYFVGRSAT